VYLELDDVAELDARCYALVRILLSLPDIDPTDLYQCQSETRRVDAENHVDFTLALV